MTASLKELLERKRDDVSGYRCDPEGYNGHMNGFDACLDPVLPVLFASEEARYAINRLESGVKWSDNADYFNDVSVALNAKFTRLREKLERE